METQNQDQFTLERVDDKIFLTASGNLQYFLTNDLKRVFNKSN